MARIEAHQGFRNPKTVRECYEKEEKVEAKPKAKASSKGKKSTKKK